MKSLVAIGMLMLMLAFCNLMGRRSANNSNSNTATENSNAPASEQSPPRSSAAAPPGIHTITANQNSAASEPPPPPAPKPTPTRPPISEGVLNGKAIKLVQPVYPPIAKAAHASGQVTVQVVIDEDGNVILAAAVSGHPLLQPAAIAAARASKFKPTKLSGQPVRVTGVVVYNFVAQ